MTDRMPCMAVKQPHASLLVAGIKDVENRNRALPEQLRGRWCAIYASKTLAPVGSWYLASGLVDNHDNRNGVRGDNGSWPWTRDVRSSRKQCARGAIVGLVKWQASRYRYAPGEKRSPWAEPGMHHWTYSDRIVLPEPVPLPDGGFQGLYWYLSEATRDDVLDAAIAGQRIPGSLLAGNA